MVYRTSIKPLVFFFSQNNTDEQITQRRTETLSQPITQSLLANVKGSGPSPNPSPAGKGRSMWGYPYKAADKRIKRSVHPHYRGISVITPLPCGGGVGGGAALSHVLLFFSQNHTEEQKSQRRTETLSQPISQNLSAIVGCWVLIVRCWWLAITLCDICRRLPAFVGSPCSQKGFCSSVKICER